MLIQLSKILAAGLSTISLAGSGAGIGIVFACLLTKIARNSILTNETNVLMLVEIYNTKIEIQQLFITNFLLIITQKIKQKTIKMNNLITCGIFMNSEGAVYNAAIQLPSLDLQKLFLVWLWIFSIVLLFYINYGQIIQWSYKYWNTKNINKTSSKNPSVNEPSESASTGSDNNGGKKPSWWDKIKNFYNDYKTPIHICGGIIIIVITWKYILPALGIGAAGAGTAEPPQPAAATTTIKTQILHPQLFEEGKFIRTKNSYPMIRTLLNSYAQLTTAPNFDHLNSAHAYGAACLGTTQQFIIDNAGAAGPVQLHNLTTLKAHLLQYSLYTTHYIQTNSDYIHAGIDFAEIANNGPWDTNDVEQHYKRCAHFFGHISDWWANQHKHEAFLISSGQVVLVYE